ncbi:DNA repair protein RadA [Bifidobacterium sp. SMB2]|uniref:DNA repair protein RadA n=1 Tax=Bifidobacterium saimiriisciurei TaxID=2661627 RepID=A0ABX0CBR8_9BIFI|nr:MULTISPECIES: DNA repair protein RadA [Bifidobacterium]NEG95213.1 DNA repair protein RadA [Bifidobacterium sp. SMB2]NEH11290.1 DNA repair protein RadA [Bifidobacterium saimiriisciurei]
MAKSSTQFLCSECGWSGGKWFGRCPECGEWGTIEEFREARPRAAARTRGAASAAGVVGVNGMAAGSRSGIGAATSHTQAAHVPDSMVVPITRVSEADVTRVPTGFGEFDRVLGGGIVPGSVVLVAGEPGIGKSTLLLETAGRVARAAAGASSAADAGGKVLYVSGEESTSQVRMRAGRIGAVNDHLLLASTTDLATVLGLIEQVNPVLAIVDSAQTIISQDVDGISGGSSQVREVAGALIDVAKTRDIPVLLVGHVTKDGSIAGPRTLEHLVDVVCQFEGDSQTALRMLRAVKNRFGPTDEVGCFDMSGEGIDEVVNPGALFLSDGDDATEGTCVTFTVDGHRSLPIEIQALVTNSVLPTPRRATNGIDSNRLAMLVAVLYRHGGIPLLNNDLYISTIAGGLAKEPACDLAIAAALASAAFHAPIARDYAAIGEISLTGQIRPVPRLEYRLREAARLGFTHVVVPRRRRGAKPVAIDGLTVIEADSVSKALKAMGVVKRR